MWNPFQKKPLGADKLPLPDQWQLVQGERSGKPIIARIHVGYRDFRGVTGFDHEVSIAVPLRRADDNGLASANENEELNALENAICGLFEQERESLFVATTTCAGIREFMLYTKNPEAARRKFKVLENRTTAHKVFLKIESDKEWSAYFKLL